MSPADGGCRSSAAAEERIFRNCILAGFRSAGSRCENSGSSDDTCASARSGSTKQRSLLCPLSERGCRHPLLFAVLDLLVLLDQAKSTRKESVRRKLFERSFAMRKLLCASRNDDYLLVPILSCPLACPNALLPLFSQCDPADQRLAKIQLKDSLFGRSRRAATHSYPTIDPHPEILSGFLRRRTERIFNS